MVKPHLLVSKFYEKLFLFCYYFPQILGTSVIKTLIFTPSAQQDCGFTCIPFSCTTGAKMLLLRKQVWAWALLLWSTLRGSRCLEIVISSGFFVCLFYKFYIFTNYSFMLESSIFITIELNIMLDERIFENHMSMLHAVNKKIYTLKILVYLWLYNEI